MAAQNKTRQDGHERTNSHIRRALSSGLPIREVEIVDALLPDVTDDVLAVNMIQRMTDSGRRVRFNVLCVVGNGDGYVGLSVCKGKEVASTIRKAIDKAKLNMIPVMRGNGSWESSEDLELVSHSRSREDPDQQELL